MAETLKAIATGCHFFEADLMNRFIRCESICGKKSWYQGIASRTKEVYCAATGATTDVST